MHALTSGLHQDAYERDSCGFGLIASLDDAPSHWLVRTAMTSLNRLTHRGAIAADGKTGDGCGLLLKRPEGFLRAVAAEAGIELSPRFASGLVFLSHDAQQAGAARLALATELTRQGLEVAGWRVVPVDPSACGAEALKTRPLIEQLFVNCRPADIDAGAFNRRLFMARRLAEKALAGDPVFYVPSLSASTIVFKGMVMPQYLAQFYPDLADPRLESSVAVFHQRFSTNTLPQWRLAHPYRYLAHNGEINTIQGNRNWATARGPLLRSALLPDLQEVLPLVSMSGSDSQSLDNMLEVLLMGGLDPLHAMRLLVPPAWHGLDALDPDLRAFYEYYSVHMEPWDGPAGVVLTDGRYALCTLDRNGLRPARFCITRNRVLTIASETGVWDYQPEDVERKGKLGPGDMLALDLQRGTLLASHDIDEILKKRHPYKSWLRQGVRYLESDLVDARLAAEPMDRDTLSLYQKMFNVTQEERDDIIRVLAQDENEAVGSMGDDTPMPVLSHTVRSLYDYFRQQFAQVTNPPIDSLRESIVMSLQTQIGPECNIFEPAPGHARQIVLGSPILSQRKLRQILAIEEVTHEFIDLQYEPAEGLRQAILRLCAQAESAVREGKLVLLLSDRYLVKGRMPAHALLVTAAVHQHLLKTGLRCKCNLLVETGTAREPHHFACLIGYGATAVYPYMAYQVLFEMMRRGRVKLDFAARLELGRSYRAGLRKGLFKIMSKMGISTIASYRSSQLFEIVGLAQEVVELCFTGTASRVAGADFEDLEADLKELAARAWNPREAIAQGGLLKYMHGGEYHMYNPDVIAALQAAVISGDYEHYKVFARLVNAEVLQIKIAQGAKPGEGGQLPGHKVNDMIASLRFARAGVGLISPPPHHDIYSIEDLAQLIFDLKQVNPRALVSVKLVAEPGVGTVAAGVTKAYADLITISGYDGGTGASPLSSIKYAGTPWELGLAETHQTLRRNDLRHRVRLQTDGGLKTGLDVVKAAILGAESFGFGSAPMVALGCKYLRICHLNNCTTGIATQHNVLRTKYFTGLPEMVINYFRFVAEEVREILASLGVRSLAEIIGRTEHLEVVRGETPKQRKLDLAPMLSTGGLAADAPQFCLTDSNPPFDRGELAERMVRDMLPAIENRSGGEWHYELSNFNRSTGARVAGEIARRWGNYGMEDAPLTVRCSGSAGQSFGVWNAGGLNLYLEGDANDYVGKGMAAGRIVLRHPSRARFVAKDTVIMGNTDRKR